MSAVADLVHNRKLRHPQLTPASYRDALQKAIKWTRYHAESSGTNEVGSSFSPGLHMGNFMRTLAIAEGARALVADNACPEKFIEDRSRKWSAMAATSSFQHGPGPAYCRRTIVPENLSPRDLDVDTVPA